MAWISESNPCQSGPKRSVLSLHHDCALRMRQLLMLSHAALQMLSFMVRSSTTIARYPVR